MKGMSLAYWLYQICFILAFELRVEKLAYLFERNLILLYRHAQYASYPTHN